MTSALYHVIDSTVIIKSHAFMKLYNKGFSYRVKQKKKNQGFFDTFLLNRDIVSLALPKTFYDFM